MGGSVLVTGASSGIGAATAIRLAGAGFRVFGTSRRGRPEEDSRLAEAPIDWLTLDVRDETSIRAAVDTLLAAAGGLDALVCNAGFGIFGSVERTPLDAARDQFETNVFGTLATLRATLPALRASRGRVVVVGSLAGRAPIPFQAHYSATKAATDSLTGALANEVHPLGVRVSLVEPGDIQTAFNDDIDFEAVDDAVYGASLERCRTVVRTSLDHAPPADVVARTIERALTARRPRFRYAVGREAPLVALGRRLLPDRLALWAIRRNFRV